MSIYEKDFNIQFCDVGENNGLTEKGALRLFQEIAIIASSNVGYGLNDESKTHFAWLLLNWKLQLFSRPQWNSKVTIKTWPSSFEKFYSYREFEMYDENNNLVAIAASKWLLFNTETKSIQKITDDMAKKYNCNEKTVFDTPLNDKLKEPDNYTSTFNYTVQRRDIDTNHHVNNLCYLDFAYNALPDDLLQNYKINEIEIMYKKAALYNDDIVCYYSKISDIEHTITIKSKDNTKLHSIIKIKTSN